MGTRELEARVAALERKVERLAARQANGATATHLWLDNIFGIFADDPEFEKAVRAGQEWRKAEVSEEEEAA